MSDFLVFLLEKFLITVSKSTCLAMLDSMFNLARSRSRVCDIVDRKYLFTSLLKNRKNLSADATVAGIVKNILKLIQTFGNISHKPHGPQGGDQCLKHCRNTVSG